MKRIFTFAIALMSLFVTAKAATAVFNVTVPEGTNACYMVGNFNSWNNVGKKCTMVDATHYSITLDESTFDIYQTVQITLANLEYKFLSGSGDWAYVEKDATGAEISNRKFTASPTTDIVVKWASVWKDVPPIPGYQTIDVLVPAGTFVCYIVGNFNSWAGPTAPADSCKMVQVGETNPDGTKIFEKKVFTTDANKLAYHFCAGPDWAFEQSDPTGDFHFPDVNVIVNAWKKVFDPSTVGDVTVIATIPSSSAPRVWIQGGWNGWSWSTPQEMTKNSDGTFSYTIKSIASTEYKLYNRLDSKWEGFVEADSTGVERKNRSVTATPGSAITEKITVIGWKQAFDTKVTEVSNDNHRIYINGTMIVVEGVVSNVELYNLDGRRVQSERLSGTFTSQNLKKGLYVVRVDGTARKVSVN